MKRVKIDKNKKYNIQYFDLSFSEEAPLRLISNLLLQINGTLEIRELRELGFQIHQLIEKKMILDHLFWDRSIPDDERISKL